MPVDFPLVDPSATWLTYFVGHNRPNIVRNCVFYVGEPVIMNLDSAGATAYVVRDYLGDTVDSGAVSGTAINLGTSLDPGWYRIYVTGPNNSTVFGHDYASGSFAVIRNNPNMIPRPPGDQGTAGGNGEEPNVWSKAFLGMGTSRLIVSDAQNPYGGSDSLSEAILMAGDANEAWTDPGSPYLDPVRDRYLWCTFPNGGYDYLPLPTGTPFSYFMYIYPRDMGLDFNNLYVAFGAGTVGGTAKIRVYYPDASTLVETFDNLAGGNAGAVAINAGSAYIRGEVGNGSGIGSQAPTAFGDTFRAGVAQTVAALYPLGVTRYEGPRNELPIDQVTAWKMEQFTTAVHEGHPDAKAIGPCAVALVADDVDWQEYADAGGFDNCDEISTHMYNVTTNGHINMGRNQLRDWVSVIDSSGNGDKLRWQTESTGADVPFLGVGMPNASKQAMVAVLLMEQYGITRERNNPWYDTAHGFWGVPAFFENPDGSVNPFAIMYRTLCEETFGKAHHHPIDFGNVPANNIFLGSVYGEAGVGESVAVLISGSYIPDATVTFSVLGSATELVTVDCFGNEGTVTVTGGKITVPIDENPSFIQLPQGVCLRVFEVFDWGASPPSVSSVAESTALGGIAAPVIADDDFMTAYVGGSSSPGIAFSTIQPPDSAELKFAAPQSVHRIIAFTGPCWQLMAGLTDFDVDTWDRGSNTWTTRETVTVDVPASLGFNSNQFNWGCSRETFWRQQSICPVTLASPVTCDGVRIYVRGLSRGGLPDDISVSSTIGVQGTVTPVVSLQELSVISPTVYVPGPTYVDEVTADSPFGWWRFEETSGTTFTDTVNGMVATKAGTITLTPGQPGALTTPTYSLLMEDAMTLTVPYNAVTDIGDVFSVEFWIKTTRFSARGVFHKNSSYEIGMSSAGQISLGVHTGATIVASTSNVSDGDWAHVVITKNGASCHIYLNAVDVTGAITNHTFTNIATGLTLGPWNADVDELALYPTALSAARVSAHYVAGRAPQPPLVVSAPTVSS